LTFDNLGRVIDLFYNFPLLSTSRSNSEKLLV
jgi:hypothetical protein